MDAQQMRNIVNGLFDSDPGNALPEYGIPRIFADPLVGFASADNALFQEFRQPEVVGPGHKPPAEWLPGAGTVISCFLPFAGDVRATNEPVLDGLPSWQWLAARKFGDQVSRRLREGMVRLLVNLGARAVAPSDDWRYDVRDLRSNWSERHVAWAAGLGVFGLNGSLITSRGCAGRFGSVITTMEIAPNPRPYSNHSQVRSDYCDTLCGRCIGRCPAEAISQKGRDSTLCSHYLLGSISSRLPQGARLIGCGKCQTSVPCEARYPSAPAYA